ncbi:chromate transporter [Pseudomonas asplenii]|uniref:chromate transporter n=1 Tax=Pseudomonas asplenii TaxID=53407 RepID=UPI0037C52199
MSQQAHQAGTTSVWVVFLIFLRLLLAAFWRPLWSSAILGRWILGWRQGLLLVWFGGGGRPGSLCWLEAFVGLFFEW